MPVYKNEQRNTWYASFYYTDWTGIRRKKKKEGLPSKREALEYERNFLEKMTRQCNIKFSLLVQIYLNTSEKIIKKSTYTTKTTVIRKHILPYFCNMQIDQIKSTHITQWQLWLLKNNKIKTKIYLHYINVQLSCIFNFARKYYGLSINPVKYCNIIGNIQTQRRLFWTIDEFNTFIENIDRKNPLYVLFNVLFWTGIRRGEMLALRPIDIDFKREELFISRNLVYIKSKPHISTPKTQYSRRIINMPNFLLQILKTYIRERKIQNEQILFDFKPKQIAKNLKIYSEKAGLKPIKIHDFRHSHASMLIEYGYSPVVIAERLGHKDINTTLRIYAHLYPSKQKKLAEDLNNIYERRKIVRF